MQPNLILKKCKYSLMKTGKFYREFVTHSGLSVTLRSPRWEDVDDLLELRIQLIEEEAMIGADTAINRDQMIDRHAQLIREVETGKMVAVIAEVDGKAVGQSNASKRGGRLRHNAGLGVFLKREYRNQGVGSELMRELETQSKKHDIKILYLEVYSISPAVELYKRLGYTEYGRLLRAIQYRGEYLDCTLMYKNVK